MSFVSPDVDRMSSVSPDVRQSSSSDEDDAIFMAEKTPSRGRQSNKKVRKRPLYQVGGRKIRVAPSLTVDGKETGSDSDGSVFSSQSAADGLSSRDLSPAELVREYITDCTGEMVEDFDRIIAKMGSVADGAVEAGAHIVQRTAAGGAEMSRRVAREVREVPSKVVGRVVRHWNHLSFSKLPAWMRDNEFIMFGHRPELNSFKECFASILGVHTETGNIWTHLIGFIAFITVTIIFYVKPLCDQCHTDLDIREKLIFLFFFIGAILCLGLSFLFHTVCCHSEHVSKLFCKLDYVGIALLTVGSFVPWIYYGFYCQFTIKVVYLTTISVLGLAAVIVTMWDRFSSAEYRPIRAALFVCLGGFGLVPTLHFLVMSGWQGALIEASVHRVFIMGGLYILGAILYGARIPERFLPGKCDIWFQSHQIFHVLVIAAAFVHYHGISNMAVYRLTKGGSCLNEGDYSTMQEMPEVQDMNDTHMIVE